ncbi:hypothetical protein QOT17_008446 [Balamuthia mandrillaris]
MADAQDNEREGSPPPMLPPPPSVKKKEASPWFQSLPAPNLFSGASALKPSQEEKEKGFSFGSLFPARAASASSTTPARPTLLPARPKQLAPEFKLQVPSKHQREASVFPPLPRPPSSDTPPSSSASASSSLQNVSRKAEAPFSLSPEEESTFVGSTPSSPSASSRDATTPVISAASSPIHSPSRSPYNSTTVEQVASPPAVAVTNAVHSQQTKSRTEPQTSQLMKQPSVLKTAGALSLPRTTFEFTSTPSLKKPAFSFQIPTGPAAERSITHKNTSSFHSSSSYKRPVSPQLPASALTKERRSNDYDDDASSSASSAIDSSPPPGKKRKDEQSETNASPHTSALIPSSFTVQQPSSYKAASSGYTTKAKATPPVPRDVVPFALAKQQSERTLHHSPSLSPSPSSGVDPAELLMQQTLREKELRNKADELESLFADKKQEYATKLEAMSESLCSATETLKQQLVRLYVLNNEVLFLHTPLLQEEVNQSFAAASSSAPCGEVEEEEGDEGEGEGGAHSLSAMAVEE